MNTGDRVVITDGELTGETGTITEVGPVRTGVLVDSLRKRRSLRNDMIEPRP